MKLGSICYFTLFICSNDSKLCFTLSGMQLQVSFIVWFQKEKCLMEQSGLYVLCNIFLYVWSLFLNEQTCTLIRVFVPFTKIFLSSWAVVTIIATNIMPLSRTLMQYFRMSTFCKFWDMTLENNENKQEKEIPASVIMGTEYMYHLCYNIFLQWISLHIPHIWWHFVCSCEILQHIWWHSSSVTFRN